MFITVHAAIATLAGAEIENPFLAFLAGMGLHFIFDIIPHGDKELGKRFFGLQLSKYKEEDKIKAMALYGSLDACALVIYLLVLFKTFDFARFDSVSWAIIGGIIPDILVGIYQVTKIKYIKWFYKFHNWNHHLLLNRIKNDIPIKYGILVQIIGFALIFSLYFFI